MEQLERLAPFGQGNRRPILCASAVSLTEPPRTIGGGARHLAMNLVQHGAKVRIEVSDRGAGVAEEARDEIFTAFRRGEGSRSTGIGLAICRSIVEAHGGAIGVERTFGGGATFWFTLPAGGGPR